MPSSEWSDIEVGDRVEVVYQDSEYRGLQGVVIRTGGGGHRVAIDGVPDDVGFSYRSSLKKLSKPPKRPVSPVFYSLKETT